MILSQWKSFLTNLNAGRGKPWAGQINVTALSSSCIILLELNLSGNFGFVLPIGSNNYKNGWNGIKSKYIRKSNLKAGRGEPWAGQESAMDVMANLTNVNDLDSKENLGFVPPTGSKNIQNIFCNSEYKWKAWIWIWIQPVPSKRLSKIERS